MKKIIFSGLLLLSAAFVFAQDRDRDNRDNRDKRDVPDRVRNNFHNEYPNANDAQWERSGRGWHAQYQDRDHQNRHVDSYYDRRGRRQDSHIAWSRNDLPRQYDERIRERYHPEGEYQVYRIERPNETPLFQLLLNLGGTRRTIYTDEMGNEVRYRDRH